MNGLFAAEAVFRFLTINDGCQQEAHDYCRAGHIMPTIASTSRRKIRENRHPYAHAEVQVW